MEIDSTVWKSHERDSIALLKINLKNITKKAFYVKTHLVANNIPFLIKYHDGKGKIILEIIQQYNIVYSDSLIFEKSNLKSFTKSPTLNQSFNIGYQHDGVNSIKQITPIYKSDTIDISN